jgi:hypothetical protein
MSTDHHHHHHHHDRDSHGEIPFNEKLVKIISHWIKHNEEHASNYRSWAEKAKANDQLQAAAMLEEAADMSLSVNKKFEAALAILDRK